jgi:uncharacterized protein YdiU (UPF0061 family)
MRKPLAFVLALPLLISPVLRAHALTPEEAGEKAMGLMERMAELVDKNKEDCDKMAVELNKFRKNNEALLKELKAMDDKRTDAEKDAWNKKYAARLKVASDKTMGGAMKCQKNEKVKAAFEAFQKTT